MITLFRRIRQKLIDSGSITKYLFYAIGEILLVVVGILIALQVNNWNIEKVERATEIQLLTEVVENLEMDLKNLDLKINETRQFLNSNRAVLAHLKSGEAMTDSLRFHYAWIYGHGNFQPNFIAFDNLKSVGIDIIKNDNVRIAISELYGFKYYFFVEDRRQTIWKFQEILSAELLENRRQILPYVSAEPVDFASLRTDIEFQNVITTYAFTLSWVIDRYQVGQKEIEIVRNLVIDYLDTLN